MNEHSRQEEEHGASVQLPRRGNLEQVVEKLRKERWKSWLGGEMVWRMLALRTSWSMCRLTIPVEKTRQPIPTNSPCLAVQRI